MSFNVFGPTTKKDIRVGYISTDRGYVKNISILEANQYAFKNPGTIFILETRDSTRYLTVNQLNKLTGKDALPRNNSAQDTCAGITGLEPGQDVETNSNPIVVISGAGGVGAKANAVVGRDGSILDVNVIHKGFGYRTNPNVTILDPNRRATGVVAISSIGISTIPTFEYYDQEEDFEEYDFDPANGPASLPGYGNRVGVNGEIVGGWDPTLYANFAQDPIGAEIERYQQFLRQGINPFWHTRKETPISVVFGDRTSRIVHFVDNPEWARLLTKKQVEVTRTVDSGGSGSSASSTGFADVEFEVYSQGGNQADRGLKFNFVAEDGSHQFQFKAVTFKDAVREKVTKKVKRNTKYKVTASGQYKGKGVEQGLVAGIGRKAKEIKGNKKGSVIFADFVRSSNDNDDLQVKAIKGTFNATGERKTTDGHSTNDLTYEFKEQVPAVKPKPKTVTTTETKIVKVETESFMNKYAISPVPKSDIPGSDYAGRWCTFEWEENFPYTGEYIFRGMADNNGKVYIDNNLIIDTRAFRGNPRTKDVVKKTIQEGVHRIKIDLINFPIKEKPKPKPPQDLTITYHGLNRGSTRTSGERKYPIEFEKLNPSNRRIEVSGNNSRNDNNTLKLKDGKGSDANVKFTILSSSPGVKAKFSDDGRELKVKGSGDVTIRLKYDDNPNYAGEAVRSIKIAGTTWRKERKHKGEETKTIKVGVTKEVVGKGGYVVSGDKKKVKMRDGHGDDINSTFSIASSTNNARFSNDGKRIETDGPGDVNLKLEWDDNPKIAGVAVDKIEVGGVVLDQRGKKGRDTKTLTIQAPPRPSTSSNESQAIGSIFSTIDYINKADRKLWRTNVYSRGGFINDYGVCPFNTRQSLPNNPYEGQHLIRWEKVDFPVDGNYKIEVAVDDSVKLFIGNSSGGGKMGIGNGLRSVDEGGDEVIIEKKGFVGDTNKGTGKSTYTRFFKKGSYRIRAELYQKPGGRFSFDNTAATGSGSRSNIRARFVNRGGQNYLKVEGSGTASIDFALKTDDNPRTKGNALTKVRVGLPPNDFIELKRSRSGGGRLKEKEIVTGSATFEAGREYLVKTSGSSPTSGSRIRNNGNEIGYDDDINNGYDTNARLIIRKIKDLQPAPEKGINPMALAINISTDEVEPPRIVAKTFNQNPMGAALTIDAPLPPIPQSPVVRAEGRCPENPMWSTRFPGGNEKWWPVTHRFADGSRSWSKFMNRFAISPIPPLSTPNSDGGGIVYSNTWNINIPFSGFYALKGAVDNGGRILVDGDEKISGGYFPESNFRGSVRTLAGFGAVSPPITKFFLDEGPHTITVEVQNRPQTRSKKVRKKIFSTQDWQKPLKGAGSVPVNFKITTSAKFANSVEMVGEFSYGKRYDGPQLNETTTKNLQSGKVYDVIFHSNAKGDKSGNKDYSISFEDLNPSNRRIEVSGKNSTNQNDTLKLRDGKGSDANVKFTIVSTSPGVSAKFSDDGRKLKVKGKGDVTIRLKYDDNPNYAGEAVRSITIAGTTWRKERKHKGEETKTIKVSGSGGGSKPNIRLRTAGEKVVQMEEHTDNDWKDLVISASNGRFFDISGNRAKFVVGPAVTGGTSSGTTKGGVTYNGPTLFKHNNKNWSKYMNKNNVSPFLGIPFNEDNDLITGDRTYTWSNVSFPENGRYEFRFQSDDRAELFINGTRIRESRSFRGDPRVTYAEISEGNYEVKVVCNNLNFPGRNRFRNNPTGFALKIFKDVTITTTGRPWIVNPVGISAILIPPPCPKIIEGKGTVEDIIIKQPGNGFITAPGPGYPTLVVAKGIDIAAPGINYSPDDQLLINGNPANIVVDGFGRVVEVLLPPTIITETPDIQLPSPTGIGFRGTPLNETIVVPEDVFDPDQLIQVTDLVGVKQTGYVNGKPYYGSVFSRDGQLFAGVYETIGELIPVYATLQESIDNRITTRPAAILRQGTDVSSNDPRLRIPGTPDNLV